MARHASDLEFFFEPKEFDLRLKFDAIVFLHLFLCALDERKHVRCASLVLVHNKISMFFRDLCASTHTPLKPHFIDKSAG